MPVLDMPLAKLKKYKGINPKPKDFDAFWEKGLRAMRETDPKIESVPNKTLSVSYAQFFDLYWTGVGGARIHAKLVRPTHAKGPQPVLLSFHGYSVHSGDWSDALAYVAEGFTVVSLDCRGQGGSSEDNGGTKGMTLRGHFVRGLDDEPEKLLFRQIFLDCAQMAKIVLELPGVDVKRVAARGGSQGGALTLACAALEPRVKRIAPFYPFLSDYQRVWEMDLAKDAYEELQYFFRSFDPFHEKEKEIFTKLGYIDVHHLAPRIKAETLMGITLMDPICPPSTQFAAFNRIKAKKEAVIYPDYSHEYLRGWADISMKFLLAV
ncbi:MAG TPA: alpha/beta fold hydrolase [bacterium]|nr:alpha/beta fold hydrolase [bacterium]